MADKNTKKEDIKERPAYLWDEATVELAKRVGDSIRKNEKENVIRRLELAKE